MGLHRIRDFIAGLSSGTKMLFIMTGALMPLGVIALFASIQSAQAKELQHESDAQLIAIAEARQIDLLVARSANVVRFAASTAQDGRCASAIVRALKMLQMQVPIALFAHDGSLRCATPDYTGASRMPTGSSVDVKLDLRPETGALRFTTSSAYGSTGVAELSRAALARAIGVGDATHGLELREGARSIRLAAPQQASALDQRITVAAPLGDGRIQLIATSTVSTISAMEILLVLLPLLMWAAAAIIGWLVVNELLLRPLAALRAAVASDATGPRNLPRFQSPAREIRELGDAFATSAALIEQRERSLEEGLRDQVRLTREVHHRVKNNLQVVASLIALHARGTAGEVAAAYASIQRRVDALAVVHRNHYAELEENRGVALRALVAELGANLRATAPSGAGGCQITLDMIPVNVTQDVAMPVAFLLTEIVELLMTCAPASRIAIGLSAGETPDRAVLSITSPSLADARCLYHPSRERYERIITGLARQLRSALTFDDVAARYAIAIPIAVDAAGETSSKII